MNDMKHMEHLQRIADEDVAQLQYKESTYQGSWKRRGGIGACMMMLRKIDRLEVMVKAYCYDIFAAIEADLNAGADGTVLAEIRDLRRYLLLIEAEMRAKKKVFPVAMPKVQDKVTTEASVLAEITADDLKPWANLTPQVDEPDGSPDEPMPRVPRYDGPKVMERLDDGLREQEIPASARGWYILMDAQHARYIVDRRICPVGCWEHLPRLRTELNNKEYEETLDEYKALYKWLVNDSKWVMYERYQENWGKNLFR